MSTASPAQAPDLPEILERHPAHRGSLIPLLQDIQETLGYLAPEALDALSEYLTISVNEIYGVATFYTQFRFTPPAKHKICVCQGTACHVRGGQHLLTEFEQQLGVQAGEATQDGEFDLERVACLGCCALAPVVSMDGTIHAEVSDKQVPAILSSATDKKKEGVPQ
jgi:NADH-quinone oxidoreductase subunit E